MKFLVDAQLPRRIALWLREAGHDAVHTLDLAEGNRASDAEILETAAREQRIVVTKDADFVSSFFLTRRPEKLLLISTGNITNAELDTLLVHQMGRTVSALAVADFVELNRTALIVHV